MRRAHLSPDIDGGESPLLAYRNRRAYEATRGANPRWMEEDAIHG